jgi:hypothetical protein
MPGAGSATRRSVSYVRWRERGHKLKWQLWLVARSRLHTLIIRCDQITNIHKSEHEFDGLNKLPTLGSDIFGIWRFQEGYQRVKGIQRRGTSESSRDLGIRKTPLSQPGGW